jgi:hypothetical protein
MPGRGRRQDVLDGGGIAREMQLLKDQADATAEMVGVMKHRIARDSK